MRASPPARAMLPWVSPGCGCPGVATTMAKAKATPRAHPTYPIRDADQTCCRSGGCHPAAGAERQCPFRSVVVHSATTGRGRDGQGAGPAALDIMNRCDCPTEIDEARVHAHLEICSPRDSLLVHLGEETGLRVSEMLSLRVENAFRNGAPVSVLRVPRRQLKGGKPGSRVARSVAGRSIPTNATLQAAIVRAMAARPGAAPDEPLFVSRKFGKSLTRWQATRIVRDIFRAAGLDPCRVWAAASLRRRFCRRLFHQTGSIELVRVAISHRWVTTTQSYVGLEEGDAAAAILQLGRRQSGEQTAASPAQASG